MEQIVGPRKEKRLVLLPTVQSGCSETEDKYVSSAGLSSWPTGYMISVLVKLIIFLKNIKCQNKCKKITMGKVLTVLVVLALF